MSTPLLAQEIYLLERYSSPEYFDSMRQAWEAMLDHVEDCLARFLTQLPSDYRSRPLPMQPDVVWGQRVIPNFRQTSIILSDDFIKLTHGDANGLFGAWAVTGDVRGQRDFSSEWLDELDHSASALYEELLYEADRFAMNISTTADAGWPMSVLSTNYSERRRGKLNSPQIWPAYSLDQGLQVRTGELVPESGIYLPDVDNSCPQFLIADKHAPNALVGFDGMQYESERPAFWTRVRRTTEDGINDGLVDLRPWTRTRDSNRVPGGETCPRNGWWFTPSKVASRRYFKQGEVFPIADGSEYGATFWQWDIDQSAPKL